MARPTESKIRCERAGFLDTPRARRGGSFAFCVLGVRVLDAFFALCFLICLLVQLELLQRANVITSSVNA